MAEMRHAIEFAASFGNFVPGIFSVLYVDSRQQLQVGVAGCCGYVMSHLTLFITRSGSGG